MIYAVIPIGNHEKLAAKIGDFGDKYYGRLAPDVYLVDFSGTARSLADKLGFNTEEDVLGLVVGVNSYAGFADPDVWEWFRNSDAKMTVDVHGGGIAASSPEAEATESPKGPPWWKRIPWQIVVTLGGIAISVLILSAILAQCLNNQTKLIYEQSEGVRVELTNTIDGKIEKVDEKIEKVSESISENNRYLDRIGLQVQELEKDIEKIDDKLDRALGHAGTNEEYPSAQVHSE